ncbi:AMP-binding protein, partial [Roseisolibacter sp. H3M3-2]|uniref:AMP-binding protein n=1 Tax=Roseisolibacter sp. H3M3-2 TaxID=3031323 RepID=UPI0023D9EC79
MAPGDARRAGAGAAAAPLPDASPDAPAFVVFTSGTTAAPRAVVHTQRSLRATLDAVGASLALGDGDVLYAGELHLALPALLAGARVVVPPRGRFDAARLARG